MVWNRKNKVRDVSPSRWFLEISVGSTFGVRYSGRPPDPRLPKAALQVKKKRRPCGPPDGRRSRTMIRPRIKAKDQNLGGDMFCGPTKIRTMVVVDQPPTSKYHCSRVEALEGFEADCRGPPV